MLEKTYQTAWIRGLPEYTKSNGIQMGLLDPVPPKPLANQISFTLKATTDVVKTLENLLSAKGIIPRLSVVVRTDAKSESDLAYNMADACIISVQPTMGLPTATTVSIRFQKLELVAGVNLNPGPPPGAPQVRITGSNMGWIYDSSKPSRTSGTPIEIHNFAAPDFNGRLTLILAKSSSEIEELVQNSLQSRDLILVLPDRNTRRYIEFKLWDAKAIMWDDAMHVVFEADAIECLTGKDNY